MTTVKACVDVSYAGNKGTAACLTFAEWQDEIPCSEHVVRIDDVLPYVAGEFFRRELPCLERVLCEVPVAIDLIIVDGYVWLDGGRPGLGARLFEALKQSSAVVGVAKTPFHEAKAIEVSRSGTRPLYVTAVGVDVELAATWIESMHGVYRMPTLLRRVDALCRT
jgi:deoxyribonuclease V